MKKMYNIHTIYAGVHPSMYHQFNQHGIITELPQFAVQDCTVLDSNTGHGGTSAFFGFKRWQLMELEKRFCIFDDGTGRIELSDPGVLTILLSEFGVSATGQQVELLGKRLQHCYDTKRVGMCRINWITQFFRVLKATMKEDNTTGRDIMYEVRSTLLFVDSAFGEEDGALQWVENQLLNRFTEYIESREKESVNVLLANSHIVMAEGGSRRHLPKPSLPKRPKPSQQQQEQQQQQQQQQLVLLPNRAHSLDDESLDDEWRPLTTEVVPTTSIRRSTIPTTSMSGLTIKTTTTTESTTIINFRSVNSFPSAGSNNNNKKTEKEGDDETQLASSMNTTCQQNITLTSGGKNESKDTCTTKFEQYDLFTQVVASIIMEMELAERMVNGSVKEAIDSLRERVDIETLSAGDRVFQTGQTVRRIIIVLKGNLEVATLLQQTSKQPPYRKMVRERVLVKGNILGHTHYYWHACPVARWNVHAVSNDTRIASLKFSDLDNIHMEHSRLAAFAHFMFCGDACRDQTERLNGYDAKDEESKQEQLTPKLKLRRRASLKFRNRH